MAEVLETRGADRKQREMRREFLAGIEVPSGAHVLEVGCGTGVLTRVLAGMSGVESIVGLDLAPSCSTWPRLAADLSNVRFQVRTAGPAVRTDKTFDAVGPDSTLSHVPGARARLASVPLRSGGRWPAAFDGDYVTTTVALDEHDPLQVCIDAMMANSVHDRRVMRRLPRLVCDCDPVPVRNRSHGFVETADRRLQLTVIDRGADMLAASGTIGEGLAGALKAEARRRADVGQFFGHIAYVSLIARKAAG